MKRNTVNCACKKCLMTESYSSTMSVAVLSHSLIMKTLPHRTASETMQLPSAETELGTDSRTSRKCKWTTVCLGNRWLHTRDKKYNDLPERTAEAFELQEGCPK